MTGMQANVYWSGINLRWAYSDLLSSISYQISCKHRAKDILHDALVRFAVSNNPRRHDTPHAYLRGIVSHLIIDEYRDAANFVSTDTEVVSEQKLCALTGTSGRNKAASISLAKNH